MVLEGLIVEVATRLSCAKPISWIYLQEAINDISRVQVLSNIRRDVHLTGLYLAVDFELGV